MPKVGDRLRALRARLSARPTAEHEALARRVEELERLVRAVTDPASRPVPPPQAPDRPPPRDRPYWLDLVGVLTLLGLVVYGTVAFSYVTFFSAFDVSLEEVGLLVIAGAVLFAVPYLGWLWSMQDDPPSPWPVVLVVAAGTIAIVWGPAGLRRARQVLLPLPAPAAAPLVGLLVLAIVFGGVEHGERAAATVKRLGDLREHGDLARLVLDVSTPRVCAAWVGAAPPPATLPRHELLYLGQADSILALYDVTAGRPIRVSSGNVVLVELTAAERATPTLRTCPAGGR